MARKVVRDIEKKGLLTISLKDESSAGVSRKRPNAVDCSTILQKKKSVRKSGKTFLKDVAVTKIPEKQEQVFFFHIDDQEEMKTSRTTELLRLIAGGVAILFLVNVINIYYRGMSLKNEVVASASSGYEDLLSGAGEAGNSNFVGANGAFSDAQKNFDAALDTVAFLRTNENYFFVKEKTVESVQGLLEAAKSISLAGQDFARGIESLSELPALFLQENGYPGKTDATGKASLTEKLKSDLEFLNKAQAEIESASQNLARVSPDVLPPSFREKLGTAQEKVKQINNILHGAREKIPAFLDLLGDKYPHRYLILLQNDTEARPTGGFIGSYIIADLNDGYVTKMEFHDVYELDGQLQEDIVPPPDIARVSKNWRMRDSNYSPDFAVSAEKAAWFLQKQKGPSVDTVIALNQSFIADLLEVTGPIQLSSLNAPLTKDNFQLVLSYVIESKLNGESSPKKILEELIPAFQKKLFTNAPLEKMLSAFVKGYHDKKILLYSRNEKIQKVFEELGMDGKMIQGKEGSDYLNVTAVSIGGNKSDRYMQQNIRHYTVIDADGGITDEVTITRKHTWTMKDLEGWRSALAEFGFKDLPDGIIEILGKDQNKDYVKVYVPEGSELLDVSGVAKEMVTAYNDADIHKTYFMFEMDTFPGNESKVSITYRLPSTLTFYPADTYRLNIQKQPAINDSFFEKKIFLREGLKVASEYPESFKVGEDGAISFAGSLDRDLYLSALVGVR